MGNAYMDGSLVILANTIYSNKIQKIMWYIIIGMVLTMIIDYLTAKYEIDDAKFTNTERVISIILWPVIILVIIIEIIKNNE